MMTGHTIEDTRTRVPRIWALAGGVAAAAVWWPATVVAEPIDNTWDIEAYDDCINYTTKHSMQCCIESGGVPKLPDDPNGCAAPAAEPQGAPRGPVRVPPGMIPDITVAPADPGQPPPPAVDAPVVPIGPAAG